MKTKTEDILAGLELAVREIIKPENLNVWMSVRQRSITGILKECGVDFNYSSAFLEELRNVGLIETTSRGNGLRYMVRSLAIPDAAFLARKIYDNFKERTRRDRVNDGYAPSEKSDLRPKQFCEPKRGLSGPVKVIPAEIAQLGDVGYILSDNSIKEVMIIGIGYDPCDRRRINYTVESWRKGASEEDIYNVISNVRRGEFYRTIEQALANIPIHKYVKRK